MAKTRKLEYTFSTRAAAEDFARGYHNTTKSIRKTRFGNYVLSMSHNARKNPSGRKSVHLRNFTGTIRKNRNGMVEIKGRQK